MTSRRTAAAPSVRATKAKANGRGRVSAPASASAWRSCWARVRACPGQSFGPHGCHLLPSGRVQWLLPLVLGAIGVWITLSYQRQVETAALEAARVRVFNEWRDSMEASLGDSVREPLVMALHTLVAIRHMVRAMPAADVERYDMPIVPAIDVAMQYNTRGIQREAAATDTGLFAAGFVRYVHRDELPALSSSLSATAGRTVSIADPPGGERHTGIITHMRPPSLASVFLGLDIRTVPKFWGAFMALAEVRGAAAAHIFQLPLPAYAAPVLGKFDLAVGFLSPVYRADNATRAALNDPMRVDPHSYEDPPTEKERKDRLLGFPFVLMNMPDFCKATLGGLLESGATVVVQDGTPDWLDVLGTYERNKVGPAGMRGWIQWDRPLRGGEDDVAMTCGATAIVWQHVPAYARSVPRPDDEPPITTSHEFFQERRDACAYMAALPPPLRIVRALDVAGRVWVFHIGAPPNATVVTVSGADGTEALVTGLVTSVLVVLVTSAVIYANAQRTDRVRQSGEARAAKAAREAHESTMAYACHELRNPLHAVSATTDLLLKELDDASRRLDQLAAAGASDGSPGAGHSSVGRGFAHDGGQDAAMDTDALPAGAELDLGGSDFLSGGAGRSRPGTGGLSSATRSVAASHTPRSSTTAPPIGDVIPSLQSDLQTIARSSKVMQAVVDDLLDYAKLRRGQLEIVAAPLVLRALLSDLVASHRAFASVPLSADAARNVPPLVSADELRVRQVLANGLSNACKLVSRGSIAIRASVCADVEGRIAIDTPRIAAAGHALTPGAAVRRSPAGTVLTTPSSGKHLLADSRTTLTINSSSAAESADEERQAFLLLEVLDTGPGLRGSDAKSLFEPFEQGAMARRRRNSAARRDRAKAGTGLGLAICFQLVKSMGGQIGIEDRAVVAAAAAAAAAGAPKAAAPSGARSSAAASAQGAGSAEGRADEAAAAAAAAPVSGARFWFTIPLVAVPTIAGAGAGSGVAGEFASGLAGDVETKASPASQSTAASTTSGAGTSVGRGRGSASVGRAMFAGTHWLIVDDEGINRRIAGRFLRSLGATSAQLEDGDMVEPYLREHHAWALAPRDEDTTTVTVSSPRSRDLSPKSWRSKSPLGSGKWRVGGASHSSVGGGSGITGRIMPVGALEADAARGERRLDGILMDIEMARSRGDRVCQQLRARGLVLPVIAATGNASAGDTRGFKEMGMTAVLTKPFGAASMADTLVAACTAARLATGAVTERSASTRE